MKPYLMILCVLFTLNVKAQPMTDYSLQGITVAITDMPGMLQFYKHVFKLEFEAKAMFGSTLYSTDWQGIKLLFCPADIAQNTAKQNRHQPDIKVTDLKEILKRVVKAGGKIKDQPYEQDGQLIASVYDPDRNSIVFMQDINK